MDAKELVIDRLKRAVRLLDLTVVSGNLADRHGQYFGDIDAKARVWSARALLLQAIEIQAQGLVTKAPPGIGSGP